MIGGGRVAAEHGCVCGTQHNGQHDIGFHGQRARVCIIVKFLVNIAVRLVSNGRRSGGCAAGLPSAACGCCCGCDCAGRGGGGVGSAKDSVSGVRGDARDAVRGEADTAGVTDRSGDDERGN